MAEDLSAFDEGPTASKEVLARIADRAKYAADVERQISEIEEALKSLKSELHTIRTKELPDILSEAGFSEFKLEDGTKISIDDFVSGSLPKDEARRAVAIQALEDIGGGDLMRDDLSVTFEKSQHNEALDLKASLEGKGYDVKFGSNVHASTLQAFIREKLRNGEEVDYEKIGIYVGRIAKIKLPKK
jgi:uncharacterized coiled-coil DUF342 family protein